MKVSAVFLVALMVGGFPATGRAAKPEPTPSQEEKQFQVVIEVPGQTGAQLYAKTLAWLAENVTKSAAEITKPVIELQDKDNAKIIGHAETFPFFDGRGLVPCTYTFIVETKDGKERVTFKNFVRPSSVGPLPVTSAAHLKWVRSRVELSADGLEKYLTKPADDKW